MYRSRTVLFAEDLEADVLLLKRTLSKAGLNPRLQAVTSGEEAIRYLNGEGNYANRDAHPFPDLLLLDLKMPGTDGFGVLSWLRAQPTLECLVVVVLTSSDDTNDFRRAYALRANSCVTKQMIFSGDNTESISLFHHYWIDINLCPRR